jgi:D-beta-D-heptose 7-phosphate kinase/D-beta-D-heptose 1-phosphate adenosyltransferase
MNDASHLADLAATIDTLNGARVLTVGDVMLDRYVAGEVERISPEAPIPVLRVTSERAMLGGAGNVTANLSALGGGGELVAVVGDDGAGSEVKRLLGHLDAISASLVIDDGRRTTQKTRFVGGSQQLMRADMESHNPLRGDSLDEVLALATAAVPECGAVILSDYGKGVLTQDVIDAIISTAHDCGATVIVDPKGHDYTRYKGADIVTPNKKELFEATNMAVTNDDEIILACEHLISSCEIGGVLATRSAEGMTLVMKDQPPRHFKAEAREVFDVSGAGDTVVATMALAMAAGADFNDAAQLATIAAGIVVGKAGTATLSAEELAHAVHHQDLSQAEAKLAGLDRAERITAGWRERGHKVGFTNGCFDLLHPGHISLLNQARGACDRLVVGLNSDASVKRLKGETRPVQSEAARAAVLGALAVVDLIVIFSEDTPLDLIDALRPDVLVKGADYSIDQVVGADVVQGYGGSVVLATLADGHSTTNTIKRLKSE